MKYLLFVIAALGVPPFAWVLSMNRRWLRWAFVGVVAALCLYNGTSINFFSHESYRGRARGMEVSLAHLMALSLVCALLFSRRFKRWLPDAGAKLFVLHLLLCLPSLTAAENVLFGFFEVWKMTLALVFFAAVYNYLRATDDVRTVVSALAAFAIVNLVVVAKEHVSGVWQPHGLFPHQNSMAVAMNLLGPVFFAGYIAFGPGNRFGRLCTLACVCAAGAAARSYSRMGLAMMPLGYGITYALCVVKARPRHWLSRSIPLFLAGAVALAAMAPRIAERFGEAPEASANTRVELALCAWEMIKDEPLRGVGLNNWGIKINEPYEYAELAGRETGRGEGFEDGIVETVYLLDAAECGVPALLALLAWFAWYWIECFGLAGRLKGSQLFFLPAGLCGGLAAVYVQSCFEWVLRQPMDLFCLLMCFAVVSYLGTRRDAGGRAKTEGLRA